MKIISIKWLMEKKNRADEEKRILRSFNKIQ